MTHYLEYDKIFLDNIKILIKQVVYNLLQTLMEGILNRYLIADFVTEINIKYDRLRNLATPFLYEGSRETDLVLTVDPKYIEQLSKSKSFVEGIGGAEEFVYSKSFNRSIIPYDAMLVHSSAIIVKGEALLFSAKSGVGKSTHTRLWKKAFGDEVTYINDDKPVVRFCDNKCRVYGTPFDGGSGIANNISAPLRAVIFIERGEENSICKASTNEIINRLYQSTIHSLDKDTANSMLSNFDKLINCAEFYILKCNTDISSAYVAREGLNI